MLTLICYHILITNSVHYAGLGATRKCEKGVIMNIHAAAKTLLTVAPNLETYARELEHRNMFRASHSYSSLRDPEELCQLIIDQTYRINNLRDLARKIQTLLTCSPVQHSSVITMYYFKKLTSAQIAKKLKITERTVFRRLHEAISHIAFRLDRLGINSFTFKTLLEQNLWIATMHNQQLAADHIHHNQQQQPEQPIDMSC